MSEKLTQEWLRQHGPTPTPAQAEALRLIHDKMYFLDGGTSFGLYVDDPKIRNSTLDVLFRHHWVEEVPGDFGMPNHLSLSYSGRRQHERLAQPEVIR